VNDKLHLKLLIFDIAVIVVLIAAVICYHSHSPSHSANSSLESMYELLDTQPSVMGGGV